MSAANAISTVLGLGRLAPAPGTLASLLAVLLAWPLATLGGQLAVAAAALLATVLGWWASGRYALESHRQDPSECVIDEVAGQWIACALVGRTLIAYALVFALFRLFDIWKPWPISAAERLPRGLGIMADDVVAGLAAGLAIALAAHAGLV